MKTPKNWPINLKNPKKTKSKTPLKMLKNGSIKINLLIKINSKNNKKPWKLSVTPLSLKSIKELVELEDLMKVPLMKMMLMMIFE